MLNFQEFLSEAINQQYMTKEIEEALEFISDFTLTRTKYPRE